MKSYRCVFIGGREKTTITVKANDATAALKMAQKTVPLEPYRAIEIWDETGLVSVAVDAVGARINANT